MVVCVNDHLKSGEAVVSVIYSTEIGFSPLSFLGGNPVQRSSSPRHNEIFNSRTILPKKLTKDWMINSMIANARKHRGPKPDPKNRVDPYPIRLNARQKTTEITKKECDRASYAPTGLLMKLLKSRSLVSFQSGIIGPAGLITSGSSIIAFESKLLNVSYV
jgi:hypothetical protein